MKKKAAIQPSEARDESAPVHTVILIRHGQFTRQGGEKLTAIGRRQARWAAQALKGRRVDAWFHSSMPRARETAQIIADALRVKRLREDAVLCEALPAVLPAYLRANPRLLELAGGRAGMRKETLRCARAARKYFRPPGRHSRTTVLVAHGNLIRSLMLQAIGVDPRLWPRFEILQGSITTVEIRRRDGARLLCHNECGHIPLNHRTFL